MALSSIENANETIEIMKEENLSILFVEDLLIEAEILFEQVNFAEVLRNDVVSTPFEKVEATRSLEYVNWKEIYYEDVIVITDKIIATREQSLFLRDTIEVRRNELFSISKGFRNEKSNNLFLEIEETYAAERYNDTDTLLLKLRDLIEQDQRQTSYIASLRRGAKSFFERYWVHILILSIILFIIAYFTNKKIRKTLLKNKIHKMREESKVLINLIKNPNSKV
jgi:predicted transposase YbfD/YdcC